MMTHWTRVETARAVAEVRNTAMLTRMTPHRYYIQDYPHVPTLRAILCGNSHTWPKDFTFRGNTALFTYHGEYLGHYDVEVLPHVPQLDRNGRPKNISKSRCIVHLPDRKDPVSVGNLFQTVRPEYLQINRNKQISATK